MLSLQNNQPTWCHARQEEMSPDEPLLYSDRSDPASWNLYAYGMNNPLLYTDPSGHFGEREGGPPPGLNPLDELLYRAFLNSLDNLQRAAQLGHQLIQSVDNFRNNPNCAAGITGLGQVAGGVSGGIAKHIAQYDLYKDFQGKIFVKAKGGVGEAIPTGLRIE